MNRSAVLALCLIAPFAVSSLATSLAPSRVKSKRVSKIKFVDQLDKLVQPRFQISSEVFGLERISFLGHDPLLEPTEVKSFKKMLQGAAIIHKTTYTVGFYHCVDKPGQRLSANKAHQTDHDGDEFQSYYSSLYHVVKGTVIDDYEEEGTSRKGLPNLEKVKDLCHKSMTKLAQGKTVDGHVPNWDIALRPVKADHESCVNCHANAKRGDTLGVMVYAVRLAIPSKSKVNASLVEAMDSGNASRLLSALKSGADPNFLINKNGRTPLMNIAAWGAEEEIRELMKFGAMINARDSEGSTASIYAVQKGRVENVRMLLKLHANIIPKNRRGETALSIAKEALLQNWTTSFMHEMSGEERKKQWNTIVSVLKAKLPSQVSVKKTNNSA